MNKEELDIQKEIEKYFTESTGFGKDKVRNFMDIVNKALEQKGERIEELERKLEQTEKDLTDYQFNYPIIKELEKTIKLLGERCNQLLKDKGELTDKIADIKANCDLAIEGRDIKIKELEKENAELKKKIGIYQKGMYDEIEKRDKKLTKATVLLNEFMRISKASDEDFEHDYSELIGETEQFIREIEKCNM